VILMQVLPFADNKCWKRSQAFEARRLCRGIEWRRKKAA